jgi:hypothetical protein
MTLVDNAVTFVRNDRSRRLAYLLLAVVSAILIFFPKPYVARTKIVPQDTSASAASTTALLGALGGNAQSIGSLLAGGRPSNDLYLVIGRSDSVKADVINRLGMVGPNAQFGSQRKAMLWLERHVDVHSLLGGVMEIETKLYDADRAREVTGAYASAIGSHLASYGRQIISNKRHIVDQRIRDASQRVALAESEVSEFRRSHNLAEPELQLGAALSQRADLEAELQAKQVEYRTLAQLRGPESAELMALKSDIEGLRQQIAHSTTPANGLGGPNIAGITAVQLRYLDLYRNLRFQQAMYDVYQRSAEQVAVESLAAESASYIQTIDPAHVDPDRHYNIWAIGLFGGIVLLALFTEWYAPTTGLFGRRTVTVTDPAQPALAS